MQKRGKGKNIGYSCMNPTLRTRILHPILHPKLSVNKRPLVFWCRKCRRFSKTFFVEGRVRRPTGRCKTSDFFGQKYGCFAPKVRMFSSKKSDVFVFRKESRASLLQASQASDRGRRSQGKQTEAAVWTISEHGIQPSFSDSQKDLPDSDNTKC